jgi:hypothetical protein
MIKFSISKVVKSKCQRKVTVVYYVLLLHMAHTRIFSQCNVCDSHKKTVNSAKCRRENVFLKKINKITTIILRIILKL